MAKPEWGRKVTCSSCGAKFYDMRRAPAICPSCGAENDPLAVFRPKRGSAPKPAPAAEAKPAPEPEKVTLDAEDSGGENEMLAEIEDVADDAADGEDLDETLDDDSDDNLMEDAADLTEDEHDLDEVRDHIEPSDDVVKE